MTKTEATTQMKFFLRGRNHTKLDKLSFDQLCDLYDKAKRADDHFLPAGSKEEAEWVAREKKRMEDIRSGRVLRSAKVQELYDMTIAELSNYTRLFDFSDELQKDKEEGEAEISSFRAEQDALVIERANGHVRIFTTLRRILNILTREDLEKLHKLMVGYYQGRQPSGLGIKFFEDMTTLMITDIQDNEIWSNQERWVIQRWRLFMDVGVHVLELRDGIMIPMLADQRYPLTVDTLNIMMVEGVQVIDDENEDNSSYTFVLSVQKWIMELEQAQEQAQRQ